MNFSINKKPCIHAKDVFHGYEHKKNGSRNKQKVLRVKISYIFGSSQRVVEMYFVYFFSSISFFNFNSEEHIQPNLSREYVVCHTQCTSIVL